MRYLSTWFRVCESHRRNPSRVFCHALSESHWRHAVMEVSWKCPNKYTVPFCFSSDSQQIQQLLHFLNCPFFFFSPFQTKASSIQKQDGKGKHSTLSPLTLLNKPDWWRFCGWQASTHRSFTHIHMAGLSQRLSRMAMPRAPLSSYHWYMLALNDSPAMPRTGLDKADQKPPQGAWKELHDSCNDESVPWYSFICYNRCSCPLLVLCVVLKLPSHPEVGYLKPWWYLQGCCGSDAGCTGGTQRCLCGQDPFFRPQPSQCPQQQTQQSSPCCMALHCISCPPMPFSCQDC